jgi:putative hydrolase of the HAD superfamily
MEAVCGIGFDLDHTLAIDNRLERVAFLRLLEAVLAEGGRSLGPLALEIDGIDELLTQQRRGEFSIDDAVRRFVAAHDVEPTEAHVEWFRTAAVSMVDDLVVPLPGVSRTLAALRDRGIAIAILTNGWNPIQRRKARRAGFDGEVLVSSEIGVQKPAAGSFERLLHTLGTPPEQTWYVGDDPHSDVAGAHAAGLQAIWIDWEGKEFPPDLRPAEHTIRIIDELLELVPAPVRVS